MRSLQYWVCGAALLASVGASSASAANWDPVGTELTASMVGSGTFATNSGATFNCSNATTRLAATAGQPSVLTTTHGITNPIAITGCTSLGFPATMTTFGTWEYGATSTTAVDVSATPVTAGGLIATMVIPAAGCNVAIDGPAVLGANTWNNATASLTANGATSFPITAGPGENCATVFGTSGSLSTSFTVPGASIT